jgi:hypothetical protein
MGRFVGKAIVTLAKFSEKQKLQASGFTKSQEQWRGL